jgi:hypothetical protein
MHEVDVLLYIIAAVSFFLALVLPLRRVPDGSTVWYVGLNWIALGLLAWVLVPALKVWGL